MRTFAFDLGTSTGMAWSDDGSVQGHNVTTISLKGGRFEGGGMRYLRFRQELESLSKAAVVYYEEVRRHMGTDAAHVYGGLLATLQAWCEQNSIPYQGIPVGTIKKYATGKGGGKGADKAAMIEAARTKLGYTGDSDNEADALWILACGLGRPL